MTIRRTDHVSVIVDDPQVAIAFFVASGTELEGGASVEGSSVDRVSGLDGVRVEIPKVRTPNGHGRLDPFDGIVTAS
jgi:hypothetical protein